MSRARRDRGVAALALCGSPAAAVAQTLGQGADSGPSLWRVIAALLLCAGLAVAGGFALRWRMRGGAPSLPLLGQRRVTLIERTRLSHQVDLCLIRCDEREFLITTSPRDSRFGPEITKAGTVQSDDDAA